MNRSTLRHIIVAGAALLLVIGLLFAVNLWAKSDAYTGAHRDRHHYAAPRVMHHRFMDGKYDNARGVHLPPGTFRLAKRYCNNHPHACPRSTLTRTDNRLCCDWDWLEWTGKALKTTSCLAVVVSWSWRGCDDQPEWVHRVRRVEVLCSGYAVIAFFAGLADPVVAGVAGGAAGAACLWEAVNEFWGPAL